MPLDELPIKWGNEHGVVLTYQQIAASPSTIRKLVPTSQRVLVAFDEIHHVADQARWGFSVARAFDEAYRRLLLSGTPFRHDELRITFVTYRHGQAQVDFRYGYREALIDQVVTPIFFPTVGGRMSWKRGDQEFEAAFDEQIVQRGRADRLNTAVDVGNKWLASVIKDADRRLSEMRDGGHPDAAGLVICKDQEHARAVAQIVKKVTKTNPTLAISDIADSSARLDEFKASADRWLVAVRMISEGVDIPRLRVGVYATNVTTELYSRQVVGRFIRVVPGLEEQSAFLYIPRDPLLVQSAREIQAERTHVLRDRELAHLLREKHNRKPITAADILTALSAEASIGDVIAGDETYTQAELEIANQLKQQLGLWYLADEVVAKILRAVQAAHEQV